MGPRPLVSDKRGQALVLVTVAMVGLLALGAVAYDLAVAFAAKAGAQRAADKLGFPFLGAIPINVAVRISGDQGTTEAVFTDDAQGIGQAVTQVV